MLKILCFLMEDTHKHKMPAHCFNKWAGILVSPFQNMMGITRNTHQVNNYPLVWIK